jgi:hypothetical protein
MNAAKVLVNFMFTFHYAVQHKIIADQHICVFMPGKSIDFLELEARAVVDLKLLN